MALNTGNTPVNKPKFGGKKAAPFKTGGKRDPKSPRDAKGKQRK